MVLVTISADSISRNLRTIQRPHRGYREALEFYFEESELIGYESLAATLCRVECGSYDARYRFFKAIGKNTVFRKGRLSFNVEVKASSTAVKADNPNETTRNISLSICDLTPENPCELFYYLI